MAKLKIFLLCTVFISILFSNSIAGIRVFKKDGVIHILGSGSVYKSPKYNTVRVIKRKASYYSNLYGIPSKLFLKLIKAESNFDPKAVSKKGARGLCQIMPETARIMGVKHIFNIDENLKAGARYLKLLYDKYHRWDLALAAYNAGSSAVDRYNGIPPYAETKNYVAEILKNNQPRYKILVERKGNTVIISQKFLR